MYISAPDNRAIVEYQVKEYETNAEYQVKEYDTNAEYQVRLVWDECFLGLDECFAMNVLQTCVICTRICQKMPLVLSIFAQRHFSHYTDSLHS